ncbi:discoidin domain-containing protein [Oligoflexia bacterium]|nr:discoidin domain-containing protein [Oligoflexia bacterium]
MMQHIFHHVIRIHISKPLRRACLTGVLALSVLTFVTPSSAAEVTLTNLAPPNTKPNRKEIVRVRLVDSAVNAAWRGKAGANIITMDLGTPKRVTSVGLLLAKALKARSVVIETSNTGANFSKVHEQKRIRGKRGDIVDLRGFDVTAQMFRVTLRTKQGRTRKARKKNAPALNELELREFQDQGGGNPGGNNPGGGGGNTGSTPTPTPTPSGSATPNPSPTPTPSPLVFDKTEAASISNNGNQSVGDSQKPSISDNGRYVAFDTIQNGFIPGNNSNTRTVFVRDRQAGTAELISKNQAGNPVFAQESSLSGDGRYVAFSSNSNQIVAGDNNGNVFDIFVYDRQQGQAELVSVSSSSTQSNASCGEAFISGTGRFVVFQCFDTNIVSGDNNAKLDIFVRDRTAGTTTLASVNTAGQIADDHGYNGTISDDGRYLVWDSRAQNLIANDNNNTSDVFIRDLQTGNTGLASINSMGIQANDESDFPHISGDGNYLVFQSFSTNLVSGTANRNIFLHNRVTDENYLVSADLNGNATAENFFPSISDDGRFIAFDSISPNMVPGDNNNFRDTFLHDSTLGNTVLVSQSTAGALGNADSAGAMGEFKSISGTGRHVAYITEATNLFSNDNNARQDVVVSDLK